MYFMILYFTLSARWREEKALTQRCELLCAHTTLFLSWETRLHHLGIFDAKPMWYFINISNYSYVDLWPCVLDVFDRKKSLIVLYVKFTKKLNLCCTYILNILLYYTLLYITFRTNPEIYIWYDNFFVDYNIVIHYELCLSAIFIISKYVSFFFVFFSFCYIYIIPFCIFNKKKFFLLKT